MIQNKRKVLNFNKPKKAIPTAEHNAMYQADGAPPGVYIPNMSRHDEYTWRAKHIKGDNERVEIRRSIYHAQMLIVVYKSYQNGSPRVVISCNSKLHFSLSIYAEMQLAVKEACELLGIQIPEYPDNQDGVI